MSDENFFLGLIVIVLFLVLFGIHSCQADRCDKLCAPNTGKVQYNTQSCLCKVNGKWEIGSP
jgi:hypothetical protein